MNQHDIAYVVCETNSGSVSQINKKPFYLDATEQKVTEAGEELQGESDTCLHVSGSAQMDSAVHTANTSKHDSNACDSMAFHPRFTQMLRDAV